MALVVVFLENSTLEDVVYSKNGSLTCIQMVVGAGLEKDGVMLLLSLLLLAPKHHHHRFDRKMKRRLRLGMNLEQSRITSSSFFVCPTNAGLMG
jgi:hypothetical protein